MHFVCLATCCSCRLAAVHWQSLRRTCLVPSSPPSYSVVRTPTGHAMQTAVPTHMHTDAAPCTHRPTGARPMQLARLLSSASRPYLDSLCCNCKSSY
jgi:hypothetical protein